MITPEALARVTALLGKARIAYMLSGSFASAYYGAPRSTQDIDIVIEASTPQLRALIQSLPSDEYYVDLEAALTAQMRESMFNVIDLARGWKIDLIIRKSRPFSQEEFRRRRPIEIEGLQLFVASPEDIMIAKLEWSKLAQSHRQIEDVAGILRIRGESLDRGYLAKWIRELGLENEWKTAKEESGLGSATDDLD